ncbi:UNVERIFIED_CONTAM: hypothetical protein RMT77_019080 [Armadillidium vulgare]
MTKKENILVHEYFLKLKEYLEPKEDGVKCRKIANIGGWSCAKRADGEKPVCMESLEVYRTNSSCRVYSFGVGNDFSFEQQIGKFGCQVLVFDDDQVQNFVTKVAERVFYFRVRLGPEIRVVDTRYALNSSFNYAFLYRSLDNIMELVGDSGGFIDILKMDVEGDEWDIFSHSICKGDILKRTGQIILETHFSVFENLEDISINNLLMELENYIKVFECLRENRFNLISISKNELRPTFVVLNDVILEVYSEQLWINQDYQPPRERSLLFNNDTNLTRIVDILET